VELNLSTSNSSGGTDATAWLDRVDDGYRADRSAAIITVLRVASFLGILAVLIWGLDATITAGLRRISTSLYGVTNRLIQGTINAQIVITGSSRAASHYDPRIIRRMTGRTTFNLGRNGSQTDMQLAVLRSYLKHNRQPEVVVHNLDGFSFQTTREVYNPAQYVPYLAENEFYEPLHRIDRDVWKSRYVPLYGYVAADMSFAWVHGLQAFLPLPQREDLIDGFDPRPAKWTDEFAQFRADHPQGVRWEIEPEGKRLMEGLTALCRDRGIRLLFVYSPEYGDMQALTTNRTEVFETFRQIASRDQVPIWDYSNWPHRADTRYFTNSQHLNVEGAEQFSLDLAMNLKQYIDSHRLLPPSTLRAEGPPHRKNDR
jgi:hypothetical protein